MAEPIPAQKAPSGVNVEAGKDYWWCACGRSAAQPFCDGSHKSVGLTPRNLPPWRPTRCGCAVANPAPIRRFATAATSARERIGVYQQRLSPQGAAVATAKAGLVAAEVERPRCA